MPHPLQRSGSKKRCTTRAARSGLAMPLHRQWPTLEAIVRVPSWGLGYERQGIESQNGGESNVLYGGIVYNLNPDPVDRLDLRLQEIYTSGNNLRQLADMGSTVIVARASPGIAL